MKVEKLTEEIGLPKGVTAEKKGSIVIVKGPKGSPEKKLMHSAMDIKTESNKITISAENVGKRKKRIFYSFVSHIKNLVEGALNGYVYRLKICSGHFPMNVTVTGEMFVVKNFLGEKVPRALKLKQGVKVKIDGQMISVEGSNLELVSQTAADIETLTRRRGFDFNRFQDGIYIIEKAGEKV